MTARSPSRSEICAGAPTASRSLATTPKRCASPLRSIVATAEAVGHVATTEGVKGEDVRDLMVAAVEQRFGSINRLPATIQWLTDNGSCYVSGETPRFAREIGFQPLRLRGKPAIEWNGRGLRANDQTRLRPR